MSNLEDHDAEQAEITAACEAGTCDHPECKPSTWHQKVKDLAIKTIIKDPEYCAIMSDFMYDRLKSQGVDIPALINRTREEVAEEQPKPPTETNP
jgi:hypothetical protein